MRWASGEGESGEKKEREEEEERETDKDDEGPFLDWISSSQGKKKKRAANPCIALSTQSAFFHLRDVLPPTQGIGSTTPSPPIPDFDANGIYLYCMQWLSGCFLTCARPAWPPYSRARGLVVAFKCVHRY